MGELNQNLLKQISELPRGRQLVLLATAVGSLSFFLWISLGMGSEEFSPLYRGLDTEEAARIVDALRAEKIEFTLDDGGSTVSVPVTQIPEARIRIAGKGLPGGSSSGFELFDRPAFGVTDFVHRVNFARAVQGELTRSIEQLEPVERARVQVVIPERSGMLSASQRKPSAAVVVRLAPGRELDRMQTQAIVHLVASSVESLTTADVTVVDGTGKLLAPLGDEVQAGTLPAGGAPAHQARVEAELAARIETMLEPVVGQGGVVARVSADMDFTESKITEERFDPDSQIARSETRTDEFEAAPNVEGGTPGVAANSADTPAAGGDEEPSGSTRSSETLNYEISKTVSQKLTAMGSIKRLSVAVLVDSERRGAPTGTEDGQEAADAGWSPEALQQFEQLAREAVGYSEERGDRIVVSAAPFRTPDLLLGGEPEGFMIDPQTLGLLFQGARLAAQLIALFLFIQFVVKPLIAALASGTQGSLPNLPASVADLESGMGGSGTPALAAPSPAPLSVAERVHDEAASRNEDSIATIKNWLNQG